MAITLCFVPDSLKISNRQADVSLSRRSLCGFIGVKKPNVGLRGGTSWGPLQKDRYTVADLATDSSRKTSTHSTIEDSTEHTLLSTSSDYEVVPGTEMGCSVGGTSVRLLYQPYMDYLWRYLLEKTPDFHCLPLDPDMRRATSSKGKDGARVHNWLFGASRLRRVRFTYFDAGASSQAFNSLLYPEFRFDMPLLGIDLLSFGKNKILCVIDFIPLSQESTYLKKYTEGLAPIRAGILEKLGKMTTKIYDENQFFSKELIFYRSSLGAEDPVVKVPNGKFFETYVGYLDSYFKLLYAAESNDDPAHMLDVSLRQAAYDHYSEERDPAIQLFSKYFGKEWSDKLAKDFLFPQTPL